MDVAQDLLGRFQQRRHGPLILELDLTEGLTEGAPPDPLSALLAMRRPRLSDVLEALRKAHGDERVRALIVKIGSVPIGLGMAQELRAALRAFRDTGKLTVAFAETFGELGGGSVPYYLATACARIFLQPSGDVGLTGVAIEERFLKDAFGKLGVDYQMGQRHEYKTAANTLTQTHMTDAHRESTSRIVSSVTAELVKGIAEARDLAPDRVGELMDRGPLLAPEALEAGLVDRLAYRDEVYDEVRRDVPDAQLLYVARYGRVSGLAKKVAHPRAKMVALVHANGMIRQGRSGRSPLGGGGAMGSDTITAALRAAAKDDRVQSIVLRVDSPGGSYVASDAIWREVVRLRAAAGKPVIVSMGDLAASGGYFIAMAADSIIAQPGTLTGSIGVFGGKPVVGGLLDKIGVNTELVAESRSAGISSLTTPFSEEQWARVNAWLDRVYADFVGKVAQARGLDAAKDGEFARGRVWTGADARDRGLVDELGGLEDALTLARKRGGLAADAPVRTYPRMHPLERFRPPESSEDHRSGSSIRFDMWGPLSTAASALGLPPYGPLVLPGWWTIR